MSRALRGHSGKGATGHDTKEETQDADRAVAVQYALANRFLKQRPLSKRPEKLAHNHRAIQDGYRREGLLS